MKFDKKQTISLRTPSAKTAKHFMPKPDNVGGFAIVIEDYHFRNKKFLPGDLVRISFNQRYVQEYDQIQVISIANEMPWERKYMGNHYIFLKSYLRNIKRIPEGSVVRLMSKEYLPPSNTKLVVKSHNKGVITVEYNNTDIEIKDSHVEGVPSVEMDERRDPHYPPLISDFLEDEPEEGPFYHRDGIPDPDWEPTISYGPDHFSSETTF